MKISKMNFGGKNHFINDILNSINRDVLYSLSFEQLAEIKKAIEENLPKRKKHSIDVHFTLPFLFKRYYFVFSSGTDTRGNKKATQKQIEQRVRTRTSDIVIVFASFFCLSAFIGTIIYRIIKLIAARL